MPKNSIFIDGMLGFYDISFENRINDLYSASYFFLGVIFGTFFVILGVVNR